MLFTWVTIILGHRNDSHFPGNWPNRQWVFPKWLAPSHQGMSRKQGRDMLRLEGGCREARHTRRWGPSSQPPLPAPPSPWNHLARQLHCQHLPSPHHLRWEGEVTPRDTRVQDDLDSGTVWLCLMRVDCYTLSQIQDTEENVMYSFTENVTSGCRSSCQCGGLRQEWGLQMHSLGGHPPLSELALGRG